MSHASENSSVFRCTLKVVIVAEHLVTGDREFQTAGAMMLNALDWKLIAKYVFIAMWLAINCYSVVIYGFSCNQDSCIASGEESRI